MQLLAGKLQRFAYASNRVRSAPRRKRLVFLRLNAGPVLGEKWQPTCLSSSYDISLGGQENIVTRSFLSGSNQFRRFWMVVAVTAVLTGVASLPARASLICEAAQVGSSGPLPAIPYTYFNGSTLGYQTTGSTSCSVSDPQTFSTSTGSSNKFTLSMGQVLTASATPGSLHAETSVSITDSPQQYLSYDANGNPVDVTNPYWGTYNRYADVLSKDWIQVVDPGYSGMVQLLFTGQLHGSVANSGCAFGGDSSIAASFSVQGGGASLYQHMSQFACAGASSGGALGTVSVPVGTVINLTQFLAAGVEAPFGFYNNGQSVSPFIQNASGSADASNTATLYIEVLTPGASYISGSGVTYATSPTAVPEPASLTLVGAALLGLATPFAAPEAATRGKGLSFPPALLARRGPAYPPPPPSPRSVETKDLAADLRGVCG